MKSLQHQQGKYNYPLILTKQVEDQFLRGMAYEETTGKAYLVNQNRLHQYIFIQILRNKRQLDSRKFKQLYDMHKKQKTSQICNGPTQF